jgi:hypothetical protein
MITNPSQAPLKLTRGIFFDPGPGCLKRVFDAEFRVQGSGFKLRVQG